MRKISFIFLFVLIGFYVLAQDFKMSDTLPMNPNIHYGKLDNGLTYYVLHNSEPKNRAYLQLVVNAGSVLEDDDQKGLAHMCEHMAFNGTKNFPKHQLIEYLESLGMRFGADLNAYTSFDETVYMIEIPLDSAGFLDKGLQVIYDWATNVSYETEEINAERGVIFEEWRLGQGAEDRVSRQTLPLVFYGSKYAKRLPIGDTAVFMHCPPDNLRRFYKDWYRPDLQAIVVVGDFDADLVTKKVKEIFSKIPARTNERERVYPEMPKHKETLVKVATDPEMSYNSLSFYIKYDMPQYATVEDFKQEKIRDMVAMMLNSRFHEISIKPDAPFTYSGVYNFSLVGKTNMFLAFVFPKEKQILNTVKVVSAEFQRAREFGFTQTELDRMKSSMINDAKKNFDNRNKISSDTWTRKIRGNFTVSHHYLLSPETEYLLTKEIASQITLDEVNNVAKKILSKENNVITYSGVDDGNIPTEQQILDVYENAAKEKIEAYKEETTDKKLVPNEPQAGKVVKEKIDDVTGVTEWTLSNGIKVVLKPTDFNDNQILLNGFSEGGYSLYPLKDNLDARFCANLATQNGLGEYNSVELMKFMSDKNVRLRPFVRLYSEGFSGETTKDDFELMLQLIYEYFTAPQFDEDIFETAKEREKTFLQNKANSPRMIWQDSLICAMTNNNLYVKPMQLSDIEKLNNDNCARIFKERFADPGSFTFVFVGSIDKDSIKPIIEKYLGGLPAVDNKEKLNEVGDKYPKEMKKVIARKGKDPKSLVYTVFAGDIKPNLKNEIYLKALSFVMSDSLLDQIREKKQWTYSIWASSQIDAKPNNQYSISIFYSCAPQNVDSVNNRIVRIADNLSKTEIPDQELAKTIKKLKREHEADMRKNRYWLNQLTDIYQSGGEADFVTDYEEIAESITKKTIQKTAKKYIKNYYLSIILMPEE